LVGKWAFSTADARSARALPGGEEEPMSPTEAADEAAAVVDVLYAYCHTLDAGDALGCADCFTADAVWEAVWTDGTPIEGFRHAGREELVAFFRQIAVEHPPWTQHHLVNNPRVQVDGDEAAAQSYFTTVLPGAPPQVGSAGRYLDRLVRGADGAWRFAVRTIVAVRP
jgi:uncharacterized protein (TIGR02246 family)